MVVASDEQLVLAVQNTLTDDEVTVNMTRVNDAYLSILNRYNETKNYRKHLKTIIAERLTGVQFVSSLRKK